MQRQKLEGLEAGRGIAAMLVVVYHSGVHCRHAYGQFPLGQVFAFGHAGVDFFFVLSGFIIFHAHRRDLGRKERLGNYFERRITRIYPLYWLVLGATLAFAFVARHPFPSLEHIVVSALLSPTVGGIIVVDAWTLQHEMVFYFLFALFILNVRLGAVAFLAWLLFLLTCTQLSVKWESGLLSKLSSYFNFEFFLGMGASWLTSRGPIPTPRLFAAVGATAFLAVGISEDLGALPPTNIFLHAGYGLSAMLAIIGLAAWERQSGLSVPAPLAKLGGASYSIYLVHVLTIGAVWQILQRLGLADKLPAVVVFALLVIVATAAGLVTSSYAEKPLLRLLRRRGGTKPQPVQPRPVG